MKRKFSLFALLVVIIACLTFGLVACGGEEEDGRVNPRIVLETDQFEIALDLFDSMDYEAPYAGVYYENLDRVDGVEVRASLKDSLGSYIYENELDYANKIKIPSFTGKYELIYSADGCADAVITIYVCERLEMGTDFTLENGVLTWEEVYGAVGYEVSVNGKNPVFTKTASFSSDIFAEEGFYVGVIAKGDNKTWIDSYMSSYENRMALVGGELAAFNNPCYELDIVPAIPNTFNAPPEQIEYLTEEQCKGSTGGALRFLMKSGEYGTGLFRLYLQKTIDKNEDFDGMEIRFKLDSNSYIYDGVETTTRFLLAGPSTDEIRVSRGSYLYEGHNDSWQILKIAKSAVDNFDTLNYLQFSLYNMTRSGGKGYLYLDYIRLYKDEIATPTNVVINGDKLEWNDVENAASYIVSVDKTDDADDYLHRSLYTATTSEIALTDIGIDAAIATQQYEIQVMAVSEDRNIGSSAWSEKVAKRAMLAEKDVSPIDNAIYTMDVTDTLTYTHIYYKEYEGVSGAEGNKAIYMVMNANSTYGAYSCFTVNLTKPLNLESKYDCVFLRFQLIETNYTSLDTLSIQLVGKSNNQNYGASSTQFRQKISVGEWIDYRMSLDDLKTYYETGDTQLSFQITNSVENKSGGTVYLKVAVDYLRYYNSLVAPTNVRIDGNTLKWDAVDGASDYTVNVNGVAYGGVTETSYDISGFMGANTLKVLANSASSELASSIYSEEAYYEVLAEDNLASFNHGGYVSQVVAGNPNIADNTLNGEIREIKYDASLGNEGALLIRLRADRAVSGGKNHIFTVNLAKGLDLTNKRAIQISFCVADLSKSSVDGTPATVIKFMALHATSQDLSYTAGVVASSATVTLDATYTNFQTLTLSIEQLKELGYTDGMNYLTFSVWTNKDTFPNGGGSLWLAIDDISYCKMIATPTNVRVEGNIVKWDAVDTADSYVVSVDGVETTVTGTSFDLSSYAQSGAVRVKVRAIPVDLEEWEASEFSKDVLKFYLEEDEIANFNHPMYTEIVTIASGVRYYPGSASGVWKSEPVYTDGLVSFKILKDKYGTYVGNTKLAAFKITLSEAIDLTKPGIKIRIYMEYSTDPNDPMTVCLLHDSKVNTWNSTPTKPLATTQGASWTELAISSAQMQAIGYKAGDKVLTFGVYTSLESNNFGYNVQVMLDWIKYGVEGEFTEIEEEEGGEQSENENMIADFSDENNGTVSNIEGFLNEYREQPTYTGNGSVTVGLPLDRYAKDGSSAYLAAFKVTLPKGLDLKKDGILVRVKFYDHSNVAGFNPTVFSLLAKDGQSSWQNNGNNDLPSAAMVKGEWIELKISSAQLEALGYQDGDTTLYFAGWESNGWPYNAKVGMWFEIDSISYYKENV